MKMLVTHFKSCMTSVTSFAGKCCIYYTLVLPFQWAFFMNFVQLAPQQQQLSNNFKPQLNFDDSNPAHDVTVIISATFKMCYEHFHSAKLLNSGYLRKIFWYKKYLFFCQCPCLSWLMTVSLCRQLTCKRMLSMGNCTSMLNV